MWTLEGSSNAALVFRIHHTDGIRQCVPWQNIKRECIDYVDIIFCRPTVHDKEHDPGRNAGCSAGYFGKTINWWSISFRIWLRLYCHRLDLVLPRPPGLVAGQWLLTTWLATPFSVPAVCFFLVLPYQPLFLGWLPGCFFTIKRLPGDGFSSTNSSRF